jgi:hypothetical protein
MKINNTMENTNNTTPLNFYPHSVDIKPKHGAEGQYREFISAEKDRCGCDIYCSYCDHWNTVLNTNILFSVIGRCKNCNAEIGIHYSK